jgi:hypothetical protein
MCFSTGAAVFDCDGSPAASARQGDFIDFPFQKDSMT